jgi:hypothetical protein
MDEDIKSKILSKANWHVIIRPLKFEKEKIEFSDLDSIVRNCSISLRGWDYPHIQATRPYGGTSSGPGFIQSETEFTYHIETWRYYQSGLFIHRFAFPEDGWEDPTSFWVLGNLYRITEIYEFASNLAARDALGDRLQVSINIYNTENRSLSFNDPTKELGSYQCKENKLSFSQDYSRTTIVGEAHEVAMDRIISIFQSFGWKSKNLKNILKPYQDEFIGGKLLH